MARWDVIVYCTVRKGFFRVGHVEAETIEDAMRVYGQQYKWYLSRKMKEPLCRRRGFR